MSALNYRLALQRTSTLLSVSILTLVLLAGVTGILLAFYYEPGAGTAYRSLQTITQFVSGGQLVRSLHDIAGNGAIVLSLAEILVLFLGRQPRRSWFVAWVSGFLLAAAAMGLSWTAIILDWDQVGFWRFKIELGIINSIPVLGPIVRQILAGGDGISALTVQHLYTLHSYVLSAVGVALAVLHLGTLIYQNWERQQVRQQLDAIVSRSIEAKVEEELERSVASNS